MPVNKVFKTRIRMERSARLESLGYSDADISLMIGLSLSGLAQMKMTDEYKQVRLQISSGVLAEMDATIGEETEEMRNRLRNQVPVALQAIADLVSQKSDSKLRLQAATEILDRDGRFMKASRTVVDDKASLPSYLTDKDAEVVNRILSAQQPAQVQQSKDVPKTKDGETVQ